MAAHYETAIDVISSIDSDMKNTKTPSKSAALAIVMLLALPVSSFAGQESYVDSLWNNAGKAYTEGLWQDAVQGYEQISSMGLESAALYCNTGNAYYKSGNVPKAILNYERALKIDPSYEDARYNLEYLSEQIQDKIDPVPAFILGVWMEKVCRLMDSDAWAVMFIVLFALTAAMLLLFLLAATVAGRKTGFSLGIITIIMAVFSLTFSLWQKNDYESTDAAVVMMPVAAVKSSPSAESSQNLFILHEGTKVFIIDQVGTWFNIELADGRQGWIKASDIETI
jgi:tetratricopeptide (TPR) repeat protein